MTKLRSITFIILLSVSIAVTYLILWNDYQFDHKKHFLMASEMGDSPNRSPPKLVASRFPDIISYELFADNSLKYDLNKLDDRLTIVTSYFDIGSFRKGYDGYFTPKLYRQWLTTFSLLQNPVVAYFDDQSVVTYFNTIRSRFPANMTVIRLVDRKSLWSFTLEPHIKKIFNRFFYPKHYPNTYNTAYSCTMHAKYELMRRTVRENPHNTQYFAWLDAGLFRQLVPNRSQPVIQDKPLFRLKLPPNFNTSSVAYSQVYTPDPQLTSAAEIIGKNEVWVCGCFFVARADVMFTWTVEYLRGVVKMLELDEMSTDQQVLYWMRTNLMLRTNIQTYSNVEKPDDYFYLGYLCKEDLNATKRTDSLYENSI